jgi:hypothetical protein
LLVAVIAALLAGELDELLVQQSKTRDLPKTKRAAQRVPLAVLC